VGQQPQQQAALLLPPATKQRTVVAVQLQAHLVMPPRARRPPARATLWLVWTWTCCGAWPTRL
jgi:hypothetical protein